MPGVSFDMRFARLSYQNRARTQNVFIIDNSLVFAIWYLVILPMSFATIIAKSFLPKILLLLVLAYLAICLLLFIAQRKLIYLPSRTNQPLSVGFEPWLITNSSGATEFS